MISMNCPKCAGRFRLPDDLAGRQVRCEKCAAVFAVPTESSQPVSAPALEIPAPPPLIGETLLPAPPFMPPPVAAEPPTPPVAADPPVPTLAAAPAPVPPPIPVSVGRALAALGCFILAMLGTGGAAAYFVSASLAPSLPRTLPADLPVTNHVADFHFHERARKRDFKADGIVRDERVNRKQKEDGPNLVTLSLELGPDGSAEAPARLVHVQPWMNVGNHDPRIPLRRFRVTLLREERYNFVVNARGFPPRVRIRDGNIVVATREENVASRCFLSYQPLRSGEYIIEVTPSDDRADGTFDLTFAKVTPVPAVRLEVAAGRPVFRQHELRATDPLDMAAPLDNGPYRDYLIPVDAGVDYEFRVVGAGFQPNFRLYEDQRSIGLFAIVNERDITTTYRPRVKGEVRFRVTSTNKGMGAYTLEVTQR